MISEGIATMNTVRSMFAGATLLAYAGPFCQGDLWGMAGPDCPSSNALRQMAV